MYRVIKDLSIEEKARRYDEAVKKVNDYYEGKTKLYSDVDKTLDYLFPALKESEGEKVRKMLIEFFSRGAECNSSTNGIPDKDIITWLEKQGEQKPADKIEQEYHCTGVREPKEATGVLKQLLNKENYAWSDEDEELFTISLDNLIELNDRYGEEYGRVGECIRWFKSIKDRVQPQPKQEWSEEDKVKINRIVAFLENLNLKKLNIIDGNNTFKKDVEWLKSLRPQNTWKPSDEQMKAIADALSLAKNCGEESSFYLRRLYEQLKKLRGD